MYGDFFVCHGDWGYYWYLVMGWEDMPEMPDVLQYTVESFQ